MGEGLPVILTIRGTQWEGSVVPDAVELVTEGRLYRKDAAWYLLYRESEVTGLDGTTTTIRVDDARTVSLIRTGTTHMKLTFVEGCRHVTRMRMPFGTLDVGVFTHAVRTRLTEAGGEVHLGYTVEMNSRGATNSQLDVTFRPAGGTGPAAQA